MTYQTMDVVIEGVAPTLMHNGALADPMNKWVRQIRAITAKGKKKTEADLLELQRLEFMGGLYVNEEGRPIWPGENLEAVILSGAKKSRQGKDSICGIWVLQPGKFDYEGPKTAEALWADPSFRDIRGVVVNKSRVMRTRPKFPTGWRVSFTVTYDDEVVNRESLKKWLDDAGMYEGLSDYSPRFGRFKVISAK